MTKIATFQLGELNATATYRFKAEALNGMKFSHNQTLVVDKKVLSIFIQTDKGIYKPEEKIRFRVIVLDNNLLPVKLESSSPLNIYMKVFIINKIVYIFIFFFLLLFLGCRK